MQTVNQVSRLTGVSVRTLHHYDAIGLLKPARVNEAGYRLYDEASLKRLQNILLLRELQFPLKEIKTILNNPDFNPAEAIEEQIKLLEMKYERLGKLLSFARELQKKGGNAVSFAVFDKSEIEQYKAEAKERWGKNAAYREYEEKAAAQSEADSEKSADRLMAIFAEIGEFRHLSPRDEAVQLRIAALQSFITEHYYTCTNGILSGLGEMYVCDERFRKSIDGAGGEGTAEFARQAISVYCTE